MSSFALSILLLFSGVVLSSFQSCKMPSCCQHDEHATVPSTEQTHEKKSTVPIEQAIVIEITSREQFDQLTQKPTVVKFTAGWCAACKAIQKTYEKVAEELHSKYQFATLDVDAFPELADKYQIRGMPTFLFFHRGEKLESQIIGANIKYIDFLNKVEKTFTGT